MHLNSTQLAFAEKEIIKIRISQSIKKCEQLVDKPKNMKTKSAHFLENKNDNIAGLSKFVEIKYSEEMGRGLYVSNNINPGK